MEDSPHPHAKHCLANRARHQFRTRLLQWAALLTLPALVAILYLDVLLMAMPVLGDALPAGSRRCKECFVPVPNSPSYINFDTQGQSEPGIYLGAENSVRQL